MSKRYQILFISAEVAPFEKRGGLGDVGGSLPIALSDLGHDVRIVMPAYRSLEESLQENRFNLDILPDRLLLPMGQETIAVGVYKGRLPGSHVPIYFISEDHYFSRPEIYGYEDDPLRFSLFSRAALELCRALGWRPDLLHANDWHTAPAVIWLATAGDSDEFFRDIPSVFSIHNLAHQGRTSWELFDFLGIWTHSLDEEAYGQVNLMARGIHHASEINTVSRTYAREILTKEGGFGLDALLRRRANDLHGILNGIDTRVWDPANDSRIASLFDVDHLENRAANKRALQAMAGLPQRDDIPILAMISRLDWQKGFDIVGHVIHLLMNGYAGEAQFIVLGTGAEKYEQMFAQLAGYHRERMTAILDYSPELAPLIYSGSDMFLMPSLFEPCGLGQMLAMRYGSVPVVRATGGLADTVHDGLNGYTFNDFDAGAFWDAIQRATWTFNGDPNLWRRLQRNGMESDFSWNKSALAYQELYERALANSRN